MDVSAPNPRSFRRRRFMSKEEAAAEGNDYPLATVSATQSPIRSRSFAPAKQRSSVSPTLKDYVQTLLQQAEAFRRKRNEPNQPPERLGGSPQRSSSVSRSRAHSSASSVVNVSTSETHTSVSSVSHPPSKAAPHPVPTVIPVTSVTLTSNTRSESRSKRDPKHQMAMDELRNALQKAIATLKEEEVRKADADAHSKSTRSQSRSRNERPQSALRSGPHVPLHPSRKQTVNTQPSTGASVPRRTASPAPVAAGRSSSGNAATVSAIPTSYSSQSQQRSSSATRAARQPETTLNLSNAAAPQAPGKSEKVVTPAEKVPAAENGQAVTVADAVPQVKVALPRLIMVSEEVNRVKEEIERMRQEQRGSVDATTRGPSLLSSQSFAPSTSTSEVASEAGAVAASEPASPVSLLQLTALSSHVAARSHEQTLRLKENLRTREQILERIRSKENSTIAERIAQLESLRMKLEEEESRLRISYEQRQKHLDEREARIRHIEDGHTMDTSAADGQTSEFYDRLMDIIVADFA